METNNGKPQSLEYWKMRGGQIEWRLAHAKQTVKEMEEDLKECDRMIQLLQTEDSQ